MLRCRGVLGFLASLFQSSLVSKFLGFEVSWFQRLWVSKFLGFTVLPKSISCFLEDIDAISEMFKNLLDRSSGFVGAHLFQENPNF